MTTFLSEQIINLGSFLSATFGLTLSVALLLRVSQKVAIYLAIRYNGFRCLYFTGILGVPIHELSHAATAILFNHNVRAISLFKPNRQTGELGCVEHSYSNTAYQQVGCFFVAIAPLFGGALALYLLNYFLFPQLNDWLANIHINTTLSMAEALHALTAVLWFADYTTIVHYFNFSWSHGIWLYAACAISLHMSPSRADLRNMWPGLFLLLSIVFVLFIFVPTGVHSLGIELQKASIIFARMLLLATVLSAIPLLLLCVMLVVKKCIYLVKRSTLHDIKS
ncbi:hypothetical protein [Pseudoalteromonas sp. T1lg23B]|uniref:hypothetical protein n=1 Tax=Pseudoalteromonas sp. T1lg23B TaxID=2077097 RepID=UPI001319EF63|nr:hypothetical protein [Pseudoalteromonas sp. T1lg23B]